MGSLLPRFVVCPVRFLLLLCVICLCLGPLGFAADAPTTNIKVDQAGYLPDAPKIAMVSVPARTFEVKRSTDSHTVFQGKIAAAVSDADTGDQVGAADFSALKQPGKYYVDVPGVGRSWNFSIAPDVFQYAYYLAMRGFYGQRCGIAVEMGPEFPRFSHPACHLKGEFHATSGKQGPRDNVGGWHDAGDYGRYMVNSGITTGTLLWTWEMFGAKVKNIRLDIPESGNGTPDILNEARWNLEWMLKMQDDDGGAWQKQTSEKFPGFIMPEDDVAPSEVIGTGKAPFKSACATADLAAVAAIAARVYQPFDQKFAGRNLEAARTAWAWAEKNPDVLFRNPPGISTGEYGDNSCKDEMVWAAAELWRTTGEKAYSDFFLQNYAEYRPILASPPAEGWREVAAMGLWSYALAKRPGADAAAVADIKNTTNKVALSITERTRKNAYHTSLVPKDYVWGSNGVAANYGMQLLVSNALTPNPAFVRAAQDNLHYLLGRNAFSLSWVTRLGENPYRHPHHRPSGGDKNEEPWPGLLSGGPNANRQDALLAKLPAGTPPAKIYVDDQASYASNEVCINWQAALVFVLAGSLQ